MAFAGVTHSAHAVGSALRTPRSLLRRNHETVVAAHVFLDQSNRPLWLVHSHYRSHVRRFSSVSYRARTHAHHLCISTSCLMGYTSRIKPYKRGNIRCTSCDGNIQTSLISASLDLMYTYLYDIILLPSLSYTTISYSYLHYGRRLLYAHFNHSQSVLQHYTRASATWRCVQKLCQRASRTVPFHVRATYLEILTTLFRPLFLSVFYFFPFCVNTWM